MSVTKLVPNSKGEMQFFTWTHTEGDANETFTVFGTALGVFVWSDENTATPVVVKCSSSLNTTTGINTITIHYTPTTTSGKGFVISSMR